MTNEQTHKPSDTNETQHHLPSVKAAVFTARVSVTFEKVHVHVHVVRARSTYKSTDSYYPLRNFRLSSSSSSTIQYWSQFAEMCWWVAARSSLCKRATAQPSAVLTTSHKRGDMRAPRY